MKIAILTIGLTFGLSAFAADSAMKTGSQKSDEVSKQAPNVVSASDSNELRVGVKGMVCAFCAQGIEKKFKAQNEIQSIQVSLENKFIKLKFKNGQRLTKEKISQILKEAGYDADFEK